MKCVGKSQGRPILLPAKEEECPASCIFSARVWVWVLHCHFFKSHPPASGEDLHKSPWLGQHMRLCPGTLAKGGGVLVCDIKVLCRGNY